MIELDEPDEFVPESGLVCLDGKWWFRRENGDLILLSDDERSFDVVI